MPEDKDKPLKPTFFQRILRIDPEETKKRVEELKKGNAELEAFRTKTLPGIIEKQLAETKAAGAARLATAQAEADRVHEQASHQPKCLEVAEDLDALTKTTTNHTNRADVRERTTVYQWNDGYNNNKIIYLPPSVGMDQVQAVSARITKQQQAFGALGTDEQTAAKANPNNPYGDFLNSDARRIRFQELTQPPSNTK